MPNVVGERFQVVIDKALREQLGVQPGDLAVERIEDGRLVVEFAPRPHRTSLLGALRDPSHPTVVDWQEVRDAAWAARAEELADPSARRRPEPQDPP